MKKIYLFLLPVLMILAMAVVSCRQSSKPAALNEIKPVSNTDSTSSAQAVNKKIGDWVKKGTECYGIVIIELKDRTIGKSVKCKVMAIKPDQVKMKTIEGVSLMESMGCDKIGLSYGDTWWETQGDIFRTREEADNYLKEKGWFIK